MAVNYERKPVGSGCFRSCQTADCDCKISIWPDRNRFRGWL